MLDHSDTVSCPTSLLGEWAEGQRRRLLCGIGCWKLGPNARPTRNTCTGLFYHMLLQHSSYSCLHFKSLPHLSLFLTPCSFLIAGFHVPLAKSTGPRFRWPDIEFYSWAMWSGTSYITSLCSSCLIYKMGTLHIKCSLQGLNKIMYMMDTINITSKWKRERVTYTFSFCRQLNRPGQRRGASLSGCGRSWVNAQRFQEWKLVPES